MRVAVLLLVLGLAGCSAEDPETASSPEPTVSSTPSVMSSPSPTPTVSAGQARRLGLRAVAALKRDDPAAALALVARGADVNAQDGLQDSVFLYAGAEGYVEVVRAALRHGADVASTNRYGGTALIPASEHAHLAVIRTLLATDIEVDHVNDLGWTALGEAVALGDGGADSQEAVRLLLAAGADPAVRDRFGRTVLQNAERLGFTQIAGQLRRGLAQP